MLPIICLLAFVSVCLFVVGLAMKGEHEMVRERIKTLQLTFNEDIERVAPELTLPFSERVFRPWLGKVAAAVAKMLPGNASASIAAKLERAGNPWRLKPAEFLGLKVLSILIFLGAGLAYAIFSSAPVAYKIIAIILGAVIGYAIPDSMLENTIRERQRLIRRALADCLDLLVVSTEAGLGFDAALSKVVERVRGPLSEEFKRVIEDMSIGRSRMEALRAMSNRVNIADVTTFVAAIHQADLLGVSIAHVLRVQADSLRIQRNLRARESAAKLPVKMLFPLVFFIFPSIFVVILGPGAMQIYKAIIAK